MNFLQKPLPPWGREWGSLFKGPARSSHLSYRILRVRTVWKTIQYWGRREEGRGGKQTRGEAFQRGARTRMYASKGVYATRNTHRVTALANAHRLRAWRTKAPGKRKDVVKKTTGERAGDAARSSSHRQYYTRYDGKLALTVSVVDFRLAPLVALGSRAFGHIRLRERRGSVRNAKVSRLEAIIISKQTKRPSPP